MNTSAAVASAVPFPVAKSGSSVGQKNSNSDSDGQRAFEDHISNDPASTGPKVAKPAQQNATTDRISAQAKSDDSALKIVELAAELLELVQKPSAPNEEAIEGSEIGGTSPIEVIDGSEPTAEVDQETEVLKQALAMTLPVAPRAGRNMSEPQNTADPDNMARAIVEGARAGSELSKDTTNIVDAQRMQKEHQGLLSNTTTSKTGLESSEKLQSQLGKVSLASLTEQDVQSAKSEPRAEPRATDVSEISSMRTDIHQPNKGQLFESSNSGALKMPDSVTVIENRQFISPLTNINATNIAKAISTTPALNDLARAPTELSSTQTVQPGNHINTLKLQLNPAELGVVHAQLRMSDGQLAVHLKVETAAAYKQLSDDTRVIENALRGHGFQVDQITIQQTTSSNQTNSSGADGGAGQQFEDLNAKRERERDGGGNGRSAQESQDEMPGDQFTNAGRADFADDGVYL